MKKSLNSLIDLIPTGRAAAISMRNLANILGVDERKTRQYVMRARMDGAIICSDENGYFIPTTREELQTYYNTVAKRQKSTAIAIAACRRKLKELE